MTRSCQISTIYTFDIDVIMYPYYYWLYYVFWVCICNSTSLGKKLFCCLFTFQHIVFFSREIINIFFFAKIIFVFTNVILGRKRSWDNILQQIERRNSDIMDSLKDIKAAMADTCSKINSLSL